MTVILYLLAASLVLGLCGLAVFLWSLRSGQYEDMEGAANRILFDDPTPPMLTQINDDNAMTSAGYRAEPANRGSHATSPNGGNRPQTDPTDPAA